MFLKIVNENTWGMVLKLLMDKTGSYNIPYWPGVTFSMDEPEGKALLSTQIGTPLAWLLIQHKVQFGLKTVLKARIFLSRDTCPAIFADLTEIGPSVPEYRHRGPEPK